MLLINKIGYIERTEILQEFYCGFRDFVRRKFMFIEGKPVRFHMESLVANLEEFIGVKKYYHICDILENIGLVTFESYVDSLISIGKLKKIYYDRSIYYDLNITCY